MAEPHSGWIRLHRIIKDHWLWDKNRRFSKFEAWVYLLLSANHQARKVDIGSKLITIGRGQVLTSQVALAKKWSWHRDTVLQFLHQLKADEMLGIETSKHTSTGYTLLTICNYSKYQDIEGQASDIQFSDTPQNPDIPTDNETDIHSPGITTENINGNLNQDIQHPTSEPASKPTSDQHPLYTNKNGKKKNKNKCSFPIFTSGNGASGLPLAESFDAFWQAYPRKVAKEDAWKAWGKLKPTPELLNAILADIGGRKKTGEWQREEKKYIPYPASYLNGNRWEDEAETEVVEDPYANWPVSVDCQACGDAHDQGETCPKMTT